MPVRLNQLLAPFVFDLKRNAAAQKDDYVSISSSLHSFLTAPLQLVQYQRLSRPSAKVVAFS
jgi:hypothetical protein